MLQLLCALDVKLLKLTKQDEEIYKEFRSQFPDIGVKLIDEDKLKSVDSKEVQIKAFSMVKFKLNIEFLLKQKWGPFCESYKGVVEDYNFATLIRIDAEKDYSEENTCIGN